MSLFRQSLEFLAALGFFDVIMPFILVFVLVYAVLQRTNVLGYFSKNGAVRKKNLDAMVAFSVAFLVIASAKATSFITDFVSKIMIIFVIMSLLVILTASLYGFSNDEFKIEQKYKKWLIIAIFVSVGVILFLLIDVKALLLSPNVQLVNTLFKQMFTGIYINWSDVFYTLITLGITVGLFYLILKEDKTETKK